MSDAKVLYPNLKHVTYLVHALHRVCETIRSHNKHADKFIIAMKRVLRKSPLRRQLFKSVCKIKLPPIPVLTRWGSWLETAFYYLDNFDNICNFINILNNNSNNKGVKTTKKLINSKNLQNQLLSLHPFRFLPEKVKYLESNSLSIRQQLDTIEEVKENLSDFALEKLENCLAKNPDLEEFTSESNNVDFRLRTAYSPLVSVTVERSFSTYKSILTDRRTNLLETNIEKFIMIKFNSFL